MSRIVALLGVCYLLVLQACVGKGGTLEQNKTSITVEDLLVAHRVSDDPTKTSVFSAEAIRKVSFHPDRAGKGSTTFERWISVARNGRLFRYERTAEAGLTKQIELFDGSAVHHLKSANGKLIDSSTQPGQSAADQVMLEIKTFGLLPILNRLMDSRPQLEFEGRGAQGLDRLRLKIGDRNWVLSTDPEHLIRRLEFSDSAIDYDDYRETQGVRLPFKQRFFLRNQLYYELTFSKVELKPIFPAGYFTREVALLELTQ